MVADLALSRYMATAGLEWRWPVLFSLDQLQPRARADGAGVRAAGRAAISASSASPTRTRRASSSTPPRCSSATSSPATTASKAAPAPISACAIPAAYGNGWTTNAILGQSYQLGGENSFAAPDLVNAGAFSGLETDDLRLCRPVRLRHAERPFGFGQRPARRADLRDAARRAEGGLCRTAGFADGANTPSSRPSRSTASPTTATR